MERLTHERVNGIKTGYWSPSTKEFLVQRLGGYEDTGLTPPEIKALHNLNQTAMKRIAELEHNVNTLQQKLMAAHKALREARHDNDE